MLLGFCTVSLSFLFFSDLDNSPAGGIGIAVSKKFVGLLAEANSVLLEPGRTTFLGMQGPLSDLTLWSVHLDHNEAGDRRLEQITLLGDATADNLGTHHLMGGDFNFTMGLEDRLNPADFVSCGGGAREVEAWDRCMSHMVELHQPGLTRKGRQGGSWARLDMIFSSLHGADLHSGMAGAQVISRGQFRGALSDHLLVLACIRKMSRGKAAGGFSVAIPEWVVEDPDWGRAVEREASRLNILGVDNPWLGLDLLKVAFHTASRTVKEARKRRLSSSVTENLFWVMRVIKALRHRSAHPLREALEIVSSLAGKIGLGGEVARDWFPSERERSRLADLAAEFSAIDIRGQVEEVLWGVDQAVPPGYQAVEAQEDEEYHYENNIHYIRTQKHV